MTYTIAGAPRTKKNHGQILRFGKFNKVMPSKAFMAYQSEAVPRLQAQHLIAPITAPVRVRATFYREKNIGDLIGYMQALADILEKAGVLANDRQIVDWDGTRMTKDAANPRVELDITEVAA